MFDELVHYNNVESSGKSKNLTRIRNFCVSHTMPLKNPRLEMLRKKATDIKTIHYFSEEF